MELSPEQRVICEEFAATLRILGRAGFEMGSAGHITVADPERSDRFWANPFGVPFVETRPEDIVLVDLEGDVVYGKHGCKGARSQTAIYAARPDVRAVVHVHGLNALAWSNLGKPFRALTTESAEVHGLQEVSASEGAPLVDGFADPRVKILFSRFHGCTTAGATLAEAAFYTLAVDRATRVELLLANVAGVNSVPDEVIAKWAIPPALADGDFRQEIDREIRTAELSSW